jgi:hypothetical protein
LGIKVKAGLHPALESASRVAIEALSLQLRGHNLFEVRNWIGRDGHWAALGIKVKAGLHPALQSASRVAIGCGRYFLAAFPRQSIYKIGCAQGRFW